VAALTAVVKAVEASVEATEEEETAVAMGVVARAGDSVAAKVGAMAEETAAGTGDGGEGGVDGDGGEGGGNSEGGDGGWDGGDGQRTAR